MQYEKKQTRSVAIENTTRKETKRQKQGSCNRYRPARKSVKSQNNCGIQAKSKELPILPMIKDQTDISASDAVLSRTRFEISMSVSSPTKVHSSMSSRSSVSSASSAFLGDGFGENGVDDAIER